MSILNFNGGMILNPKLYDKAKEIVYNQYPKHSAYRSGQLVKKYKELGGQYGGEKPTGNLTAWFKEEWKDIGGKDYPVFRPTKRVNKDTPLTAEEIDPKNLKEQIALKQVIKGDKNLPPFVEGGKLSRDELKGLLDASYDGRAKVGDWTIDKQLSTKTSKVYSKGDRAVVAHRGTEGITDWGNNLAFALGGEYLYKKTDRYKEAEAVQKKAEKKYGAKNVSTIGHSQGGLQAEMLGSKSKEIITLNKATHPLIKRHSGNQTDIRSDRDIVSIATKTPTTEIKAESYNPLKEHSPDILDRVSADTEYGSGINTRTKNALNGIFYFPDKIGRSPPEKVETKNKRNSLTMSNEGSGITEWSNPTIAKENAIKYLGEDVVFKLSTKKDKKFMVLNPETNKFIHFGALNYEDFTKHQDPIRRNNYLKRTANMRGDWKDDMYSANNLARNILWGRQEELEGKGIIDKDTTGVLRKQLSKSEKDYINNEVLPIISETTIAMNVNRVNSGKGRSQVFGYGRRRGLGFGAFANNSKNSELYKALVLLGKKIVPSYIPWTAIQVNHNYQTKKHIDGNNIGLSLSVSFGDFTGGELVVGNTDYQTKLHPVIFNGALSEHFNRPISGNRYSLVYFISAPADATDEAILKLHNKVITEV